MSPTVSVTRLLLVDDHPLVREGLKARLSTLPALEVVGEAGSAEEACSQLALTAPDLVLMDVGMKDVNGIDLTRELLARRPDSRFGGRHEACVFALGVASHHTAAAKRPPRVFQVRGTTRRPA